MADKEVLAHETSVEIDAPIEEVWKALTEAKDIARWFAPNMTVEPGAGGEMVADWGPGIVWKNAIEVWEPNRHLRLVETRDHFISASPAEDKMEPCRLLQDYYLEAKGGKTVLRMVHSGFGTSSNWIQEYEGTRDGWAVCFLRLKTLLERHKNDTVHNLMLTALCYGMDYVKAMAEIVAALPKAFEITLRGKYSISGFIRDVNDSILSVSVQPSSMGTVAYLELMLYGLPDEKAKAIENEWRAKLSQIFPTAAATPAT
ncbi:MAG TPA: SRPBCC domain-containing protein [Bryobacteraceae bacterium]|nr:SRPBCC domain-containing protein [Bryobacteraceae bacterium]